QYIKTPEADTGLLALKNIPNPSS
ncbi:unnamed protein product, partial [Rotaria sordida]